MSVCSPKPADANDSHTFTFVSGDGDDDNGLFAIDGTTLKTDTTFDFEDASTRTVRIRTTDEGGLSVEDIVIITIGDEAEGLSIDDVTQSEGTAKKGSTIFTFTITRTGDTSAPATAKLKLKFGTATKKDVKKLSKKQKKVKFAAGETTKVVELKVKPDSKVEDDEQFTLTLSDAKGVTIVDATATGTIEDDD